jgi:dynein light intermediate chain
MNSDEQLNKYITSPIFLQYAEKKSQELKEDDFFARINLGNKKKKENQKNNETEKDIKKSPIISETLNNMFPPKQWEESGHKYIQYISQKIATRDDCRELFKALDKKLKERRAKEKGICPVRQELYSQCFDEIIRQVTIDNTERGLLLLKVRDEIKMSIASYQILYESAILYGIRKQLQSEDAREELKKTLEEKEKKTIELTNKKIALENKLQSLKKHFAERKEIEASKREKDLNFLNQQKESLDKIIRNISQPIK